MNMEEAINQAPSDVKQKEEYNTSCHINGMSYKLAELDKGLTPCLFVDYEIVSDEDEPCEFGMLWYKLDTEPSKEELKQYNVFYEE